MDPEEEKDEEMKFQKAKRDLKAVYGHSDSESSDNERRKMAHVMFRGSWDITSWYVIKTAQEHGRGRAVPASCLPDHRQHQVVPHTNRWWCSSQPHQPHSFQEAVDSDVKALAITLIV
jgi:hypothetical protein